MKRMVTMGDFMAHGLKVSIMDMVLSVDEVALVDSLPLAYVSSLDADGFAWRHNVKGTRPEFTGIIECHTAGGDFMQIPSFLAAFSLTSDDPVHIWRPLINQVIPEDTQEDTSPAPQYTDNTKYFGEDIYSITTMGEPCFEDRQVRVTAPARGAGWAFLAGKDKEIDNAMHAIGDYSANARMVITKLFAKGLLGASYQHSQQEESAE